MNEERSAIDHAKMNAIRNIEGVIGSKWGQATGRSYIPSDVRAELAVWIFDLTEQMKINFYEEIETSISLFREKSQIREAVELNNALQTIRNLVSFSQLMPSDEDSLDIGMQYNENKLDNIPQCVVDDIFGKGYLLALKHLKQSQPKQECDEDMRQIALKKADEAYSDINSPHYKDNERYSWAVETINKRFKQSQPKD